MRCGSRLLNDTTTLIPRDISVDMWIAFHVTETTHLYGTLGYKAHEFRLEQPAVIRKTNASFYG